MDEEIVKKEIHIATESFINKGAILAGFGEFYSFLKVGNVRIRITTDHEGPSLSFTNDKTAKYYKLIKQTMTDDIDFPYAYWVINKLSPDEFLKRNGKLKEVNSFEFQVKFVLENWDKILEMFSDKNYKKTFKAVDKLDREIGKASMNYTEEELFDDDFLEDK